MKKEIEEQIKKHWDDPDFDKLRLLFQDYLVINGDFDDKYLGRIAHLLGISIGNSEDGYDLWWELNEPQSIKYINL